MTDFEDFFDYEDSDAEYDHDAADAADFQATFSEAYHNDCLDLETRIGNGEILSSIA